MEQAGSSRSAVPNGDTIPIVRDIQGKGDLTLDPSLLYAAAARIELEALELD